MGRSARPNLPNAVFHVTARTQGRHPWFTPALRTAALDIIAEWLPHSRHKLLAFGMMPNHLHLVLQQGVLALSRLMQPVMRRLALLLQREHCLEGHVFARRFHARPCIDPQHARNAILYTNINPVRAKLCEDSNEYIWTSHCTYVDDTAPTALHSLVSVEDGIQLFATDRDAPMTALRASYRAYLEWRLARDRLLEATPDELPLDTPTADVPWAREGDAYWADHFAPFVEPHAAPWIQPDRTATRLADLRDFALGVLSAVAPELPIGLVRSRYGGSEFVRARHALIRRAAAAGYRNVEICRYLNLSESAVSRVVVAVGKAAIGARSK
jgi:REP element-mobilizing transposase RayT